MEALNTSYNIEEHSRIKLGIYKEYLKAYLAIMAVQPRYKQINVVDPFAGVGIANNGQEGSAVIAKDIISGMKTDKVIRLFLNELDKNNFQQLQKNVGEHDFVTFCNEDADKFLFEMSAGTLFGHILYFIDPFGYTQISKSTYDSYLLKSRNSDILMFIPIYHIYRFLTKKVNVPLMAPIARFLNDLNISEADAKKVASYKDFAILIRETLRKNANTPFVYYKIIDNESSNSHYALFFITKHVLGAEKFIEAMRKANQQLDLLYKIIATNDEMDFADTIKSYGKTINNRQLYVGGISRGLLPTDINKTLTQLEQQGKIAVSSLPGQRRVGKAFYVNYSNYEKEPKIEIKWIGE